MIKMKEAFVDYLRDTFYHIDGKTFPLYVNPTILEIKEMIFTCGMVMKQFIVLL